jgi:hypothetical protein
MVYSRQLQIANFRSQSLEMENIFPHYPATCVGYTSSYVCKTAAIQDICRYRNILGTVLCTVCPETYQIQMNGAVQYRT